MQPPCSGSWEGWSRQRLCTNEVCHHNRPTCANMHSFRMQRMRHSSRVRGNIITNGLSWCLSHSFQRRLKDNLNCWRITVRKQGSWHRRWAIGSKRVKAPSNAQPIEKLSRIFGKGSHYSKRSPRHLSVPDEKWTCLSPWEDH